MIIFILQSAFLLLVSFVIGLLIGRFIKRRLLNWAAISLREDHAVGITAGKPVTIAPVVGDRSDVSFSAGIKPDNLQIVEGIGPAMESVLKENGIATWSQLAAKTVPELRGILDQYGKKYQIIDPTIWLEQARLAAEGRSEELIRLQKLDGVSKLENMLNQDTKSGFGQYQQDDLKIVEGIGPKIEVLLNNAGINTWRALSQTELSTIKDILHVAGPRYRLAIPESWPLQAKLADRGEWIKLKQCQDRLRDVRPVRVDNSTMEAVT